MSGGSLISVKTLEKDGTLLGNFNKQITSPVGWIKAVILILCLTISLWIGWEYSLYTHVNGWQFWLWLVCVCLTVAILYRSGFHIEQEDIRLIPFLFLAALMIRIINLGSIPGAFHVDEAGVARFAMVDLFGNPGQVINPFMTGPGSQPALYHYLILASMKFSGFSIGGARLSSAIAGSLGAITSYFLIKHFSGKRTAIFATVLLVCSHFDIHYSRLALNNIWDTIWVPLIIFLFSKGWEEKWDGGGVLAGVALGFSQYFYHGSKIVLFLLLFLVFTRWQVGGSAKRKIFFLIRMGITALVIAGPLVSFSFIKPDFYYARLHDDWGWKNQAVFTALGEINYGKYIWHQGVHSLGVYNYFPDPNGFYHPVIPLVFGLSSVIFQTGFLTALIRKNWLPILWILLTSFFGGFLLSVPNSSPHFVVSIPAIFWLAGLAISWVWDRGFPKLAVVLLISAAFMDLFYYFVVYTYSIPPDFTVLFPNG